MAKYRKKPVVIEAALYDGTLVGEAFETPNGHHVRPLSCPDWFPAVTRECDPTFAAPGEIVTSHGKLYIPTSEGVMCASPGDWIICGIKGELYPCKPDVFAATYDPA